MMVSIPYRYFQHHYHTLLKLFNAESLSRNALSTGVEPLYTNVYHVDPLDGAVSPYGLGIEIYGLPPYILKNNFYILKEM